MADHPRRVSRLVDRRPFRVGTAYLLARPGIIRETDRMDQQTPPQVRMPNRDGFVSPDPRPDVVKP